MVEETFELLLRCGFNILMHQLVALKYQDLQDLFSGKLNFSRDAQERPIIDKLLVSDVHIFHLSKIAGDREMRERYR